MSLVVQFSSIAKADMTVDIVQTETQLEERVTHLLRAQDPQAQAVVKIVLKHQEAELPGMGSGAVDLVSPGRLSKIRLEDVEELRVMILTSEEKLPDWLLEQINKTLDYTGIKKTISFKKVLSPKEEIKNLVAEKMDSWQTKFDESSKKLTSGLLYGGIAFMAILIFGAIFIAFSIRHGFNLNLGSLNLLAEKLGDRSFGSSSQRSAPQSSAPANSFAGSGGTSAVNGGQGAGMGNHLSNGSSSHSEFSNFSNESLLALVSDCYWSGQDRYAAWVWANLTDVQRQSVISELPYGFSYARYIYSLEPEQASYHQHPSYSDAPPIHKVSNADLKKLVLADHSMWRSLSEIRQKGLGFTFKERLEQESHQLSHDKLSQDKKIDGKIAKQKTVWPTFVASTARELPQVLGDMDLTVEDEDYLFENPSVIRASQRSRIPSFVWLALLEQAKRQEILGQYSAEDLAQAWVGSAQILKIIEESLPEKKREMLNGYRERTTPSRQHWVLAEICNQALAHMAANQNENREMGITNAA
jgi:hypothetical protein